MGVDPDAEGAESVTAYNYSDNNPIMFNDPAGDKAYTGYSPLTNLGGGGVDPEDLGDWFAQVGMSMQFDYFNSLPGGANYVGTNYDPETGASVVNGLNYDTNISSSQIAGVVSDALAFAGISTGASAQASPTDLTAGPTDLGNVNSSNGDLNVSNATAQDEYSVSNRPETTPQGNQVFVYGAKIQQYFDVSDLNSQSYNFISIVNRNPDPYINGNYLKSPVIDGHYNTKGKNVNYPFYMYAPVGDKWIYNQGTIIYFGDNPGSSLETNFFYAETTLVGINNGILTPLLTFGWGYASIGGSTVLIPNALTVFSNTPNFTMGIIAGYNILYQILHSGLIPY